MAKYVQCPVCEERFELETDLEAGDTTDCPRCSAELKVTRLNPPEVEEVAGLSYDNNNNEEEDYDGNFEDEQ